MRPGRQEFGPLPFSTLPCSRDRPAVSLYGPYVDVVCKRISIRSSAGGVTTDDRLHSSQALPSCLAEDNMGRRTE